MQSIDSTLLIIGQNPKQNFDFNYEVVNSIKELQQKLLVRQFKVIAFSYTYGLTKEFQDTIRNYSKSENLTQYVLYNSEKLSGRDLAMIVDKVPIHSFSSSMDQIEFQNDVIKCLNDYQTKRQNLDFATLVDQRTTELKQWQESLELKVQSRQDHLEELRKKTYFAQVRWDLTKQALMSLLNVKSVSEIEKNLLDVLLPSLDIAHIRVFFPPYDQDFDLQLKQTKTFSRHKVALFHQEDALGHIFYLKHPDASFSREDIDQLNKLSEAVSQSLFRLNKLEQAENMKNEWMTTFNSISDPVMIINEKYEILQFNKALELKNKNHTKSKKCYEVLFHKDKPCSWCQLGNSFKIEGPRNKSVSYEVSSHAFKFNEQNHYVNLYHDVTEQLKLERRLIENSKLVELGTIGSSIAHELNNPLGGILSYVQLMLMDIKPKHVLYDDLKEIEEGVRRCRDIILNLLSFTRDPSAEEKQRFNLFSALDRAIKIVELKTKSLGIEIKIKNDSTDYPLDGYFNLLAQAFKNILTRSIESILDTQQKNKNDKGIIEIHILKKQNEYEMLFIDNSNGFEGFSHLALSVAHQIINDHNGSLEAIKSNTTFQTIKVTFSRPVL